MSWFPLLWFRSKRKRMTSVVGRGTQVEGTLQAAGHLKVNGSVYGLVMANGDINVSETGFVEGTEIRGHDITVHGVVKAHIYAEGKLTLGATARIHGDAIAGVINVSPGAYYTGYIATYDSRTPFYRDSSAEDGFVEDLSRNALLSSQSRAQVRAQAIAESAAAKQAAVEAFRSDALAAKRLMRG